MLEWAELRLIVIEYGTKSLLSIVILLLALPVFKFVKSIITKLLLKSFVIPDLLTLLIELVRFFYWVLIFAFILNIFNFEEIALALGGSLAVLGLGLAKSISSLASDLISGIFLIFDTDFNVGIQVKAGGVEGVVESIGIRKVKIRDGSDELHVIPNQKVDGSTIIIKNDQV